MRVFPWKGCQMAILITEGLARPELATVATLPTNPPSIVTTKPRRQRLTSARRIERDASGAMWESDDEPGVYLPSPETIAAACAAIRSTWSELEHRARGGMLTPTGRIPKWTPPGADRGLRGEA